MKKDYKNVDLGAVGHSHQFIWNLYYGFLHGKKVLPFGIKASVDSTLFGVWAYTGWIFGFAIIGYGIALAFQKPIKRYLKKLNRR